MNKTTVEPKIKAKLSTLALQAHAERARYSALAQIAEQLRQDWQREETQIPRLESHAHLLLGGVRHPEGAAAHQRAVEQIQGLKDSIAAKRAEFQRLQTEASVYARHSAQISTVVDGVVRQLGTTRRELGIDYSDSQSSQPSTVIPVNSYRGGAA